MRGDTQSFARATPSAQPTPSRTPPTREASALLYAIVALTFVQFRAAPSALAGDARLFAWFGLNFLALFVIPALIIRLAWQRPLSAYGLQWGRTDVWGRYFLAYLLLMVPVVLWASRSPEFQSYYPRAAMARETFGGFCLAALGWLVYFFAWEFFFRGFLLFSLAPRYGGAMAILIQTLPFVMMHYTKVEAEAWSAIVCGLALGAMAFRSRSCLGTWLLHWAVALLMDLTIVLWPAR